MGKAKRKAQLLHVAKTKARRSLFVRSTVGLVFLVLIVVVVAFVVAKPKSEAPMTFVQPTTLEALLALKPEDLDKVDLARMNLLCATGLPGAENFKIDECLAVLDRYTAAVRWETEKNLPMYQRNPDRFAGIEGNYRMQMLITVLKKDLGLGYSSERTATESASSFYANSKDVFINGLLLPPHTGTCASLPVLVTAVAQRLGYPVKLVPTRNHLFARWESPDGKLRFNVESTNGGMTSHVDQYYTEGPYAWSGDDFDGEGYLDSMTPQSALADFLDLRGLCLAANKRWAEAHQIYALACRLKPASKILADKLRYCASKDETGQVLTSR